MAHAVSGWGGGGRGGGRICNHRPRTRGCCFCSSAHVQTALPWRQSSEDDEGVGWGGVGRRRPQLRIPWIASGTVRPGRSRRRRPLLLRAWIGPQAASLRPDSERLPACSNAEQRRAPPPKRAGPARALLPASPLVVRGTPGERAGAAHLEGGLLLRRRGRAEARRLRPEVTLSSWRRLRGTCPS